MKVGDLVKFSKWHLENPIYKDEYRSHINIAIIELAKDAIFRVVMEAHPIQESVHITPYSKLS